MHLDHHWALLRQAHDELDSSAGSEALAEAELAQFHTLYEVYEMNLLRENVAQMSLNLELPPNIILEFNGEYLGWPRFHDLFVELVHNKPYLASQKLHILQSSLLGEARNIFTDTAFSQGGYDDTWLRLKARYQNGKILVFAAIALYRRLLAPTEGLTRHYQKPRCQHNILGFNPVFYYKKKPRPAVSSCTGKFSGCTNGNSNV